MMAMPSLQWADLVWHCLPSLSPLPTSPPLLSQGIIPSRTTTSTLQHGAMPQLWGQWLW